MSLINNRSASEILNDLVVTFQATQPDINLNEASTIYILFQIYAFISALNVATAQDFALSAFIETSESTNLTALAEDRGVDRILADYAITTLTFSRLIVDNTNAYTIPASSSFSTIPDENGDYLQFNTFDSVTLSASSLSVTGTAQAAVAGADYNVPDGTVTNFITSVNGIDEVTNAGATGGSDEETDEDLRARIKLVLQNNGSKVTVSGYQNTLLSLGAASALVTAGTGSMPNYIIAIVTSPDTANTIPTAAEISLWQAGVNSDDNRAPADVVQVFAPTAITITVSAAITVYSDSVDEDTVKDNVQTTVIDYINDLAPGADVYITEIANSIHDQTGVVDFVMYLPASNTVISSTKKAITDSTKVTIT